MNINDLESKLNNIQNELDNNNIKTIINDINNSSNMLISWFYYK